MQIAQRAKPRTRRRPALTRERVLRTAIALADERGVESLTMRKLAKELGVEAMSLYNHVENKDDLLGDMVDVVFSEIDLPSSGGDWKAAMRRRAVSTREALTRHRWAIGLMESRALPGPANLRLHDAVLGCLREAGFSIEMAIHAYSVQDAYIYGFALQEKTVPFEGPEEVAAVAEMQIEHFQAVLPEYPHIAEVVGGHVAKSGYDFADEFVFGLDLILDGLDGLRDPR